jgi:parvulin-like peptidyl-prolyl isomerase
MRRRADRLAWPLLLLLVPAATARSAGGEVIDRIILRVNDQIATLGEYEARKEERIGQIAQATDLSVEDRRKMVAEAGRATMKEIFEEMLVLSRAHQLHLEATPSQIDRAIDNAKSRFGFDNDADFQQALAQSGLTLDEYRKRMAKNILFNQVFEQEIQSKAQVDDEAVARYWHDHADEFRRPERRRIEEVVVRDDSSLSADAREALASDIAARVRAGATMTAAVAAENAGTAVTDVFHHDWVEPGTLAPELESAAWKLAAGGVSDPVTARGGLHVLHVLEVQPAGERPLEDVQDQIRTKLGQERFESRLREFLDQQAASAYIVDNVPPEAAGYRDLAAAGQADPVRALLRGASEAAPPAPVSPATGTPPPAPEQTAPPAAGPAPPTGTESANPPAAEPPPPTPDSTPPASEPTPPPPGNGV